MGAWFEDRVEGAVGAVLAINTLSRCGCKCSKNIHVGEKMRYDVQYCTDSHMYLYSTTVSVLTVIRKFFRFRFGSKFQYFFCQLKMKMKAEG